MISPKTALVSALLKASSSVGAFVEYFTGEPDPSHSGFIAFTLLFKAPFCFTVLDLEALVFLALPFRSSLHCFVGLVRPRRCPCSSAPLLGMPLQ